MNNFGAPELNERQVIAAAVDDAKKEKRVRDALVPLLVQDFAKGFIYYTRLYAGALDRQYPKDQPEADRLLFYKRKPPIAPDGLPPPHIEPVPCPAQAPCWFHFAAEFQAEYEWFVADYLNLTAKELSA